MPTLDTSEIERVFRSESGRAVATLVRFFGDIDLAEEAVQDAFVVALQHWPEEGLPPSPAGWIITTARRRGSEAHDEMWRDDLGVIRRRSGRAGGTEGGMSTGEVLRVRAAMKPISTVPRSLDTVDIAGDEPAKAIHQRSDVCAVPAAGVVAEAMVALVLAQACVEKFGGDSVRETARNYQGYLDAIPQRLRSW